jgi:hypothetical protein
VCACARIATGSSIGLCGFETGRILARSITLSLLLLSFGCSDRPEPRYQLVAVQGAVFKIDTQTGQTWAMSPETGHWRWVVDDSIPF